MPDREKITYGLRCMCYGDVECKECPYARNGSGWHDCRSNCAKDALAMMKEQEAVEPRVSSVEQRCGNCNKVIEMDGWKACPWCGKPILWEAVGRQVMLE